MTTLPLAPVYRNAIRIALALQAITTLGLLTVLDGGTLAKAGGCAMVGFWIGVTIVMIRRPRTPNSLDLLYVAMLVVGMVLSPWMGLFRGWFW